MKALHIGSFVKLAVCVALLCLLVPVSGQAAEQTGVYIAPKFVLNVQHAKGEWSSGGETYSDSKTATRAGGALAVGYDFSKKFDVPVRAELEYGIYDRASKTVGVEGVGSLKTEVGVQTLLLNAYYDFGNFSSFTPYVGGGLGVAFLRTKGTIDFTPLGIPEFSGSDTETVFAGQIGLGASYAFTDYVALDLGYRFLMMGNGKTSCEFAGTEIAKVKSKENYAHQFMLGLRFSF